MSENPEVQQSKQPKPFLFPSRIILFAILGVLVIGQVIDLRARSAASTAFEAIQGALGPENRGGVTRSQVREIIGREPDSDKDANDRFETYSWRGGLRTQNIYVSYHDGSNPLVEEVRRNEKPPGFEEPPRTGVAPVDHEEGASDSDISSSEERTPPTETPTGDNSERTESENADPPAQP